MLSWYGFLDRLRTVPHYLPCSRTVDYWLPLPETWSQDQELHLVSPFSLPDKDSNLVPLVQSQISYRLDDQALAPLVGNAPTYFGFGDRVATLAQRYVVTRTGIEPVVQGYEPSVLPLHYREEPHVGIEPTSPVWKTGMLPLHQ